MLDPKEKKVYRLFEADLVQDPSDDHASVGTLAFALDQLADRIRTLENYELKSKIFGLRISYSAFNGLPAAAAEYSTRDGKVHRVLYAVEVEAS